MYVSYVCLCVYVLRACLVPTDVRRGHWIPATTVQMIVNGTQDLWKCSHYSIFPVPATLYFKYRVCKESAAH